MKSLDPLMSVLVENPPLARLVFASLELAVAALLLAALLRLLRPRSPRLVSFLWLIVLAKPVFSLVAGSPIAVLRLEAPPIATAARVETSHASDPVAREPARHEDLASATASAPDRVGSSPPSIPAPARLLKAIEPARLVLGQGLGAAAQLHEGARQGTGITARQRRILRQRAAHQAADVPERGGC